MAVSFASSEFGNFSKRYSINMPNCTRNKKYNQEPKIFINCINFKMIKNTNFRILQIVQIIKMCLEKRVPHNRNFIFGTATNSLHTIKVNVAADKSRQILSAS